MAATDAMPVPRKNTAFRFSFAIRKPADSTLITSWAGADSEVSLDGAAYSDCTNEATEIGTSGTGFIDLTAAEMNADTVILKVTVTNTGAVPLVFTFNPEEIGDYRIMSASATMRLERSARTISLGTMGISSTPTAVVASSLDPLSIEDDQWNGKVISFPDDTTTPALRGQSCLITDYDHASLTFTVSTLSEAPVSGDIFTIT